jgi:Family of unknown function (DUF6459)
MTALALEQAGPRTAAGPALRAAGDGLDARARRFLQAVVEMAGADRPVVQLLHWATPEVYAEVCRHADAVAASSDTRHRSRTGRPRVVSVHVGRPADGVAEVAAHVRHAGRSRALAARLELRQGRWVCTALQLG